MESVDYENKKIHGISLAKTKLEIWVSYWVATDQIRRQCNKIDLFEIKNTTKS